MPLTESQRTRIGELRNAIESCQRELEQLTRIEESDRRADETRGALALISEHTSAAQKHLDMAVAIANETKVPFDFGEYGRGARYYPPGHDEFVSYEREGFTGWLSSSERC